MSSIYQDSFERARPNLAYQAVHNRLSLVKAVTSDLAAYYHERALLEDAYVKSLQKLSSRLRSSGSSTVLSAVEGLGLDRRDEDRQLGAWSAVRGRLEEEVTETARVHEAWRKKVADEVEGPLRQSLGKPEWMRWLQSESTLGSTVKEYDSTLEKVQKVSSPLSSPSRALVHSPPHTGSEQRRVQIVQVDHLEAPHGAIPPRDPRFLPLLRPSLLPLFVPVPR
jgi:hypothetical protein